MSSTPPVPPAPAPASRPCTIATITAVARLAHAIDVMRAFRDLPVSSPLSCPCTMKRIRRIVPTSSSRSSDEEKEGGQEEDRQAFEIVALQVRKGDEQASRGAAIPRDKKKTKARKEGGGERRSRPFDNQVSLTLLSPMGNRISAKIFANGTVHMAGLRTIGQGRGCVREIASAVARYQLYDKDKDLRLHDDSTDDSAIAEAIASMRVCLIKSDFHAGFAVRCDTLYALLCAEHVRCAYEPCERAGLRVTCPQGVTGIVYRSGSTVLTGALTYAQLGEGYAYLRGLLDRHQHSVNNNSNFAVVMGRS